VLVEGGVEGGYILDIWQLFYTALDDGNGRGIMSDSNKLEWSSDACFHTMAPDPPEVQCAGTSLRLSASALCNHPV
jgi:hypothetical protein